MDKKSISIGEAIHFAWGVVKRDFGFFVLLMITLLFVQFFSAIIEALLDLEEMPTVSWVVAITAFLLHLLVYMGVMKISLKYVDGKEPRYSDLFSCAPQLVNFTVATIGYAIVVCIGFILFVVPGVIWGIRFGQFGYLVVDQNERVLQSLDRSAKLTMGAKWDILGLYLVLWLLNILGVLALLVGLVVTIPISIIAQAFVYRKLLEQTTEVATE